MNCKICQSATYAIDDQQFKTTYHRCNICGFIYEDPTDHMSLTHEEEEYERHNNSIEDEGYVNMFKRFQTAITPFIQGKELLEYGSGPEPVFSELMRRDGYEVTSYDPFFLPDESYLEKKYDVITSTEVFEHFVEPMKEMTKLVSLMKKNGILAIMTQFPKDDEHFKNWWYRRDPTHISFYTIESFKKMTEVFPIEIVYNNDKDYMVFQKK